MQKEFDEIATGESPTPAAEPTAPSPESRKPAFNWLEFLAQLGLSDTVTRIGVNLLTLLGIALVIWVMQAFFKDLPTAPPTTNLGAGSLAATTTAPLEVSAIPQAKAIYKGIPRSAQIRTIIPNRPRQEIIQYTVQSGDTIIGIGEKFGLKPQTVLWGNYYSLLDDPHRLQPGQELNILPVDGTYYEWQPGDGLNGVARGFNVKPEEIVNFPANRLNPTIIGDYANPNIKPGTWLIVPGGTRFFVSWSAPVGITRDNPAIARQMGPGACGPVADGAVGFGNFIWPSNKHYLSGFDYSPDTNHRGIDIAGSTGEGVYAVDAGVIVYAGWNDYGYGSMIVVDHGNGWQSLYAHLSALNVVCGMSVGQGTTIGAIGSTGRSSGAHLHFELMHTSYGKVNPWSYLPPP